ncbi:protein-disulfide reductase DsbD [Acinetobacter sp. MD2]|uniref:protein-disulfide reductase DsbD n=1 Tax=Acinetobacter sp. MD2 TaxID=2600066 RepID=UPI002D1F3BF8|nr:protein-disulfide reductase DsbD [Acinetobacter sp. MD2]MEB3766871.1 protein-disulfide reductase DsbD [Acinetobacter sp. MD2]
MLNSSVLSEAIGQRLLRYCFYFWCCVCSLSLHAESTRFLTADQAFVFSAESENKHQAELSWKIQPHFYLYQHKISVTPQGRQAISLKYPQAVKQHDDNFGQTLVYFDQVKLKIATQPNQSYVVTWQGCEQDRICYPPQSTTVQTDASGLVSLQDQPVAAQPSLLALSEKNQAQLAPQQNTIVANSTRMQTPESPEGLAAQDQTWQMRLSQHSFAYSLLLFLGLGCLLAFTPCSLPMLPIVSSLLIREHRGVKAWLIALVFVCSMALVYAALGMMAASIGLGFQRWLQQPAILATFSGLFVLFALNLFGVFELKMPHQITHHLGRWQNMQQGGSLLGAMLMGIVSALLVGPCMTAPLAGALLFIAQTQQQWQGAILLFVLGFGMGIPLLLVSLIGTRILPKAGQWMHYIKVLFAFVMLALALYFVRALLPLMLFSGLQLLLLCSFAFYLMYGIYTHPRGLKVLYVVLFLGVVPILAYQQYQNFKHQPSVTQSNTLIWHRATTAVEFKQLLAQAPKDQAIVVDVYADWCTACQPIEHHILTQPQVQQALQPFYLIKLDLSDYDASHQALLKEWDILGPPTYLFLNPQHQEERQLRLTGAFEQQALIQQAKLLLQR